MEVGEFEPHFFALEHWRADVILKRTEDGFEATISYHSAHPEAKEPPSHWINARTVYFATDDVVEARNRLRNYIANPDGHEMFPPSMRYIEPPDSPR